jgi:hypothetical protein
MSNVATVRELNKLVAHARKAYGFKTHRGDWTTSSAKDGSRVHVYHRHNLIATYTR